MDLLVRKAGYADIETIAALAKMIWYAHYPGIITSEQIAYMLHAKYSALALKESMDEGEIFYLATRSDVPVAYASIQKTESGYFLHKFYVDVNEHRSGIGKELWQYIVNETDASLPMRLQVNRANYKAINFYFKQGFIIESVGDFDIGGGYSMNDFVMLRKPSKEI